MTGISSRREKERPWIDERTQTHDNHVIDGAFFTRPTRSIDVGRQSCSAPRLHRCVHAIPPACATAIPSTRARLSRGTDTRQPNNHHGSDRREGAPSRASPRAVLSAASLRTRRADGAATPAGGRGGLGPSRASSASAHAAGGRLVQERGCAKEGLGTEPQAFLTNTEWE